MPIISNIGSKSMSARLVVAGIYLALTVAGITMVVPFMITVSASLSNDFDYDTFRPLPRYIYYRPDRYVRYMVNCFNRYLKWYDQMDCRFRDKPAHWTSWREAGHDTVNIEKMAEPWLNVPEDSAEFAHWKKLAADYSHWADTYPSIEMLAPVSNVEAAEYLVEKYENQYLQEHPDNRLRGKKLRGAVLDLLGKRWEIPLKQVYTIDFEKSEIRLPYYQQSYWHREENKYLDFADIKRAYAHHRFTPGVPGKWRRWIKSRWDGGEVPSIVDVMQTDDPKLKELWSEFKADVAPAAPVVPLAMRAIWRSYLTSEAARDLAGLAPEDSFDVDDYNRLAGTDYTSIYDTPFPTPAAFAPGIQRLWVNFIETRYPVRLTSLEVTPELTTQYRAFLRDRFKNLAYTNKMLGTTATSWDDFDLAATPPSGEDGGLRSVWEDFVKGLPAEQRILTSSEESFQTWAMAKYQTLAGVNGAYGWDKQRLEEVFAPYDVAYAVTFRQNEYSLTFLPILRNYNFILSFIAGQSRAVFVTVILISMTIFLTLTVNPMAAYALSRFDISGKDKILLFMLATMAFPAMVSAIPAYLLMRDLGLLNTFFALVLPSAANGMGIFILKGFFDSLPKELYEAATIDGAKEWQIFTIITLPMMKPILAINSLNAFIMAYNGWQWALIICQDPKMWTLSVWMYQASLWWSQDYPWLVTAGFVIVSIPTLLVFLFCQKIILRGIIVPSMK